MVVHTQPKYYATVLLSVSVLFNMFIPTREADGWINWMTAPYRHITSSVCVCVCVCVVESSRVYLQPIRGVEGSDYINASFIDVRSCVTLYYF